MDDPVLLEILKNRFQAAAEEMASVVLHTGHTVFVKETGDFGAALVSAEGEAFACPVNTGVSLMVGHPFQEIVGKIESAFLAWEHAVFSAKANLQKINDSAETLRGELKTRHEEDEALVRLFGTLHKSIHRIQRQSIYRDWGVAAGLMAMSPDSLASFTG